MLSLGTPWLCTTLQQQYKLGNKTMYEMILHAVWMKFLAPFLTVLQPWYKFAANKWSKPSICITIFTYIWCLKYSVGLGLRPGAMMMGSVFNVWFNLLQLKKGKLALGDESVGSGSRSLLSPRDDSSGQIIVINWPYTLAPHTADELCRH